MLGGGAFGLELAINLHQHGHKRNKRRKRNNKQ
jgi:NADPH-dependent 2,4-dienoyl-CoA reductase/sulfur reductase-like enzyme